MKYMLLERTLRHLALDLVPVRGEFPARDGTFQRYMRGRCCAAHGVRRQWWAKLTSLRRSSTHNAVPSESSARPIVIVETDNTQTSRRGLAMVPLAISLRHGTTRTFHESNMGINHRIGLRSTPLSCERAKLKTVNSWKQPRDGRGQFCELGKKTQTSFSPFWPPGEIR
jgi:hypothetical protein